MDLIRQNALPSQGLASGAAPERRDVELTVRDFDLTRGRARSDSKTRRRCPPKYEPSSPSSIAHTAGREHSCHLDDTGPVLFAMLFEISNDSCPFQIDHTVHRGANSFNDHPRLPKNSVSNHDPEPVDPIKK